MAHPNKIAVGGHSYGAFMTANLLAHAPHLFCCGIARSGAYNRTLTPFGFQVCSIYKLSETLKFFSSLAVFLLPAIGAYFTFLSLDFLFYQTKSHFFLSLI